MSAVAAPIRADRSVFTVVDGYFIPNSQIAYHVANGVVLNDGRVFKDRVYA